jgi:hypothetical protein
VIQKKEIL